MFLVKDFIETTEGLVFAVVESGIEQEKVLCFLRYIAINKQWTKVDTATAHRFLSDQYPHYLYFSPCKDAYLHAVAITQISHHYQPQLRLKHLLHRPSADSVIKDLWAICNAFEVNGINPDDVGVTGSILINAQQQNSDIDLVFYQRDVFHIARHTISQLIQQGHCTSLNHHNWQVAYARRDCELSIDEYIWHEKRKLNKVLINQRIVDLSLVDNMPQNTDAAHYKKLTTVTLQAKVLDDTLAFDYPATYIIQHPHIHTVVSYTATYTGQAKKDEWIKVAGMVETRDGIKRIVVGSSREARGEYIKVVNLNNKRPLHKYKGQYIK